MKAFLTPAFLFLAAVVISVVNGKGGAVITFPFIDSLIPSTRGDLHAMGHASVMLVGGLGCITLLRAIIHR
tara:strand:- start:609 stop:821 length:213 start_codon:yes stop_codon:yes gene_type:complete